jgi:hypothetical protein
VRVVGYAAALGCALALLAVPRASFGADPPNPNDPCSNAGRNTCGTLGVGYYKTYRYGLRWFGDFRGAVPGEAHTFCIDLGFWYPSPSYRFRESSGPLRNRNDEPVSALNQQKMAYAIWRYGRSSDADRQVAVMLYVHSLMGDARPGEVDPEALGQRVVDLYDRVARDAARLHGPYRVDIAVPDGLVVGKPATATIRLRSATGEGVPDVRLAVTGDGARGLPRSAETDTEGTARVPFTPAAASLRLTVRASELASTLPRVLSPTVPAAARNGQRLIASSSQTVTDEVEASAGKTRLLVSSAVEPATIVAGTESRDRITVSGALASWRGDIAVQVFGPFASEDAIRCDGTPVAKSTIAGRGPGVYTTQPAKLDQVGLYAYVAAVSGDDAHIGVTSPCRAAGETVRVEAQPRVQTIVSSQRVAPGTAIHDRVIVSGLAGQTATVQASLYGPFGAREAIACTGTAAWTGTIDVAADGEYVTADFVATTPGYYGYRETIAASGFVRAAETACGEAAETTVVTGTPQLVTKVSSQQTRPGASITDSVVVSGLGALHVPVQATLWGPFASRGAIRCSGTPFWSGTFTANGDGTYTTEAVKIDRAGFYTYQEAIAEGPATSAFTTRCADVAETTFARAAPEVTTLVSEQVVLPGAVIFDRIRVSGLGQTDAAIDVELFGPFASRSGIACTGAPFWSGRVFAKGDGELRSPGVRVAKVGFYTYREHLIGSETVAEARTECGEATETLLSRPEIITGRGDRTRYVAGPGAGSQTPTRVQVSSLGIDAPVFASRIDLAKGVLGVPPQIGRTGWWQDGAAPGDANGAVLIAGHVDSATAGPGAFFRLRDARAGQQVRVRTASGRVFTYRVVSVRFYLKSRLPADIYSTAGPARLVLATCGGPFIEAAGHYRDNVVVTAAPSG